MDKKRNTMGTDWNITCEVCGNVYDKSFEVRMGGEVRRMYSIVSSVPSTRWRLHVPIVLPALSAMAWRLKESFIAVPTAPPNTAFTNLKIA